MPFLVEWLLSAEAGLIWCLSLSLCLLLPLCPECWQERTFFTNLYSTHKQKHTHPLRLRLRFLCCLKAVNPPVVCCFQSCLLSFFNDFHGSYKLRKPDVWQYHTAIKWPQTALNHQLKAFTSCGALLWRSERKVQALKKYIKKKKSQNIASINLNGKGGSQNRSNGMSEHSLHETNICLLLCCFLWYFFIFLY